MVHEWNIVVHEWNIVVHEWNIVVHGRGFQKQNSAEYR